MKLIKIAGLAIFGVAIFLGASACKPSVKKISPQAQQEQLLKWSLKTTVEDYAAVGRHGAWDAQANDALKLYAQKDSASASDTLEADLYSVLKSLNLSGCDDPLIKYLYVRSMVVMGDKANTELVKEFENAADALVASGYSPVRKYYAVFRAAKASEYINGKTPTEFFSYRQQILVYLKQVLQDPTTPISEIDEICSDLIFANLWNTPGPGIVELHTLISKTLMEGRSPSAMSYWLLGEHEIYYGWAVRGVGYGNTLTAEQAKGFEEHLSKAAAALEKAWQLDKTDARIPTAMLTVARAKGMDRQAMETWFERAMAINPKCYKACTEKLEYLQPKWFGSAEDMLTFGRECVASTNWGGDVSLILVDAHYHLSRYLPKGPERDNYWKNPEVWPDIHSSYERYFTLYPDDSSVRHNYVRYAYQCEQYAIVNKQLSLMTYTNLEYFGGAAEFDKMVKIAKEHGAK